VLPKLCGECECAGDKRSWVSIAKIGRLIVSGLDPVSIEEPLDLCVPLVTKGDVLIFVALFESFNNSQSRDFASADFRPQKQVSNSSYTGSNLVALGGSAVDL
jgi:hypothetical protein